MKNPLHLILKLPKDRKGFTITEVVFVIALIAILTVAILPYIRVTQKAWKTMDRRQEVIQNSRIGMDKMTRILREMTGLTSVTAATDTSGRIVFLDKDGNATEFKKYNVGSEAMLGYVTGGKTYALCGPITSLKFTCYAEDGATATTTVSDIKSVSVELIISDSEGEVATQTMISQAFVRKDATEPIVISEIMYYPCKKTGKDKEEQFEWIELYNKGSSVVDLNGWKLTNSAASDTDTISAYGGSSTSLPAGGYAVVGTKNTKVFNNLKVNTKIKLKINDNKFDKNQLGNYGDSVVLKNSSNVEIDRVSYSSGWGGGYAKGKAYSLERKDPSGDSNDSGNWAENKSKKANVTVTLGDKNKVLVVSFYCTPGVENSVAE
ncbi:MAG: prepilin-type N-terminal cleavage/methylation domain-containing protein [PVC group bacterium]|nr:prepilin-type N-terminal cleavage/methylation domain-containing protein [PVC group bacterium]